MVLAGELEELRTQLEAAERARKSAEAELSETADRVSELAGSNNSLVTAKRKLEIDIQAMQVCHFAMNYCNSNEVLAPGAARRYAPADGSSIQKSRRIYVRPRTGPQSAHLWWPAVAKLQAASVPIA